MKRSSQIALVLMGATGLGATGYAMAPRTDCTSPGQMRPPLAAGSPAQAEPCRESRGSRSGSSGSSWGSRWSNSGGGSIWHRSSTQTSAALSGGGSSDVRMSSNIRTSPNVSPGTSVARGGFGSTGHGYSSGG